MLPPFGFSVSDFIAGINLVRELIKALEDTAGSSSDYRELIKELYSLERALIEVKHLDLDESQFNQEIALRQAAAQCQETIDSFLKTIRKYQPTLSNPSNSSSKLGLRGGLRKIQWALCKKDDVEKFRAKISGHTAAISILLMTIQL